MDTEKAVKSLKNKYALKRLARAEENAIRIEKGLPPIQPWYQKTYISIMKATRTNICDVFCPCCVFKRKRKRVVPKTWYGRMFYDGTYENEVMRSLIGFFVGVFFTFLVYFIMVFKLEHKPLICLLVCAPLGFLITFGMGFFIGVRCIVFLMLPQLFSSTGRMFIMMYVMVLVLNGPLNNINANVVAMAQSALCGQQMSYNQTKELVDSATAPLKAYMDRIKKVTDSLKVFASGLRKSFMVLKNTVELISSAVKRVIQWVKNMVPKCNKKMGEPYAKCKKAFTTAERKCRAALGWFLEWMCFVVTVVGLVCNIARIPELICVVAKVIKGLIKIDFGYDFGLGLMSLSEMFYFNVSIEHKYSFNVTQSKSYAEVREAILKEVKERLKAFGIVIEIVKMMMMFTMLLVVVKAVKYRWDYLTKDDFDNIFITTEVRNIEEKRAAIERETILPIPKKEKGKYIRASSIILSPREKAKLFIGLIVLFVSMSYCYFYILCDYGLFSLLDLLRVQLNIKTEAAIPPHLKVHVQGEGSIADMYKALIGFFDPMVDKVKIDTSPCLPQPVEPDYGGYQEILLLFGLCLSSVIFEAYVLRFRHVISAFHYPMRERERAVWLYNHILKKRGGDVKFYRRQMRKSHAKASSQKKHSLISKISVKVPFLGKVFKRLGWNWKACLYCARQGRPEDLDHFQHCQNNECGAVYCMDCYDEMNNICTVCMNPVDYGDFSDFSEEKDSSDDQEEITRMREISNARRREAKERREQQAEEKPLPGDRTIVSESSLPSEASKRALSPYGSETYTNSQYSDRLSSDPYSPERRQLKTNTSKVQPKGTKTKANLVSKHIFDSESDDGKGSDDPDTVRVRIRSVRTNK